LLSVIHNVSFQHSANPCMSIDEQGSLCGVLLGCGSMYGCGTIGREGCGAIGEAANCFRVSSRFSYLKPCSLLFVILYSKRSGYVRILEAVNFGKKS